MLVKICNRDLSDLSLFYAIEIEPQIDSMRKARRFAKISAIVEESVYLFSLWYWTLKEADPNFD